MHYKDIERPSAMGKNGKVLDLIKEEPGGEIMKQFIG